MYMPIFYLLLLVLWNTNSSELNHSESSPFQRFLPPSHQPTQSIKSKTSVNIVEEALRLKLFSIFYKYKEHLKTHGSLNLFCYAQRKRFEEEISTIFKRIDYTKEPADNIRLKSRQFTFLELAYTKHIEKCILSLEKYPKIKDTEHLEDLIKDTKAIVQLCSSMGKCLKALKNPDYFPFFLTCLQEINETF